MRFDARLRPLLLLLLALPTAFPAAPATPAAAPDRPAAPRVTSRVVEVSLVAEDEKGRPVADLKAEELVLRDGGRPEHLLSFAGPPGSPKGPSAAAPLPPGTYTNRLELLAGGASSATAILFDGLNTPATRQAFARQQVLAFLRQVEPGQPVVLYTLGRGLSVLHELTTDPRPLVAALERYRSEALAGPGADREGAPLDVAGTGLEAFGSWLDQLETNLIDRYAADRALRTLRSLVAIANHLERLPGRKSLVWVSGSFPVWIGRDRVPLPSRPDPRELGPEIERAARALNAASLAVYPVDARGLMAPPDYAAERSSIGREMQLADRSGFVTMDTLAQRTGGEAFYRDNDLGRAFRRAAADAAAAYRLGYEPSHDDWNGRFREIRIEAKRPGLKLRHRRGYFAQPEAPGDEWYRSGVLGAAMWSPTDATRLGLAVRLRPSAGGTIGLEVRLDARDLVFQPTGDGFRGRFDAWLVQLGPGDALLDTVSRAADLNLDRITYEQVRAQGELPFAESVRRVPKAVLLRVLVRDVTSGALGSVSVPLSGGDERAPR
ncbi:MAG TPA: VWA domain-containing protein [Vicinamibacteria bacterium]